MCSLCQKIREPRIILQEDLVDKGKSIRRQKMRSQFDNMLEQLHVELVRMGALCEDAIAGATK